MIVYDCPWLCKLESENHPKSSFLILCYSPSRMPIPRLQSAIKMSKACPKRLRSQAETDEDIFLRRCDRCHGGDHGGRQNGYTPGFWKKSKILYQTNSRRNLEILESVESGDTLFLAVLSRTCFSFSSLHSSLPVTAKRVSRISSGSLI